jgi:hypothetical protein
MTLLAVVDPFPERVRLVCREELTVAKAGRSNGKQPPRL